MRRGVGGGGYIVQKSPESTRHYQCPRLTKDRAKTDDEGVSEGCSSLPPPPDAEMWVTCMSSTSTGQTNDGRIKAIQFRPPITTGQPSITGGLGKLEEALRDTKVGPMLHHCQEATSGQVTCLSILRSAMTPTKSQCRSRDVALLAELPGA